MKLRTTLARLFGSTRGTGFAGPQGAPLEGVAPKALRGCSTFIDEVLEHGVAMLGEDRFRVELHAVNGQRPVAQAHDFLSVGFGGDFKAVGKRVPLHD